MHIRCPRCSTEHQIPAEQIAAAAGMTHCIRCHHVFEVQDGPMDPPGPTDDPDPMPPPAPPQRRGNGAWWFLGSLALLLLLAGQLAWYHQETLLRHPQARALVEGACTQLDCRLPPLRDPQQIQILKREIKAHPEHPGALRLELVMFNAAPFAQPYPVLELSLLDTEQQVVVRRRFSPTEYLASPLDAMPSRRAHYVEMDLRDPGNTAGFHFNFL